MTDLAVCCETAEPFHRKDCRETAGKAAWGRIPDNPFCLMERAKTYLFLGSMSIVGVGFVKIPPYY